MSFLKSVYVAYISLVYSIIAAFAILLFGKKIFYPIARHWAMHLLYASGVKLKISGKDKISKDESYIFVANHSSLIDIPALLAAIDINFRIIYKKELEKIPVFGWGLKLSPFIGIKRESGRDSMSGLETAVESVRCGDSVVIFPEGTRSKDGKLGEFKRGAFLLASRSGKKIVPVTVNGSAKVLPNKKLLIISGDISINISDPITYNGSNKADEMELMKQVHDIINSKL
ncbi:MAG: 1-acyl-sn-glycerol-3-phosphate acyltransferase [Candidatus Kapabacteria bacterium]|nr:1-acyl-sn-glycerol-3-phosphate acyltransferase [Ignavibacteriota bacterium]MCW5884012.1 1-acyl-sn-glycerol-3-phosphate acyltransferase [Candidatus Kapabacteria bacterium]